MPVGSIGKWFVLGSLVAALGATGCGDEDDPVTKDAGAPPKDSGVPAMDSGPKDAGTPPADTGPADAGASIMCGTLTCKGYAPSPLVPEYAPGCVTDHNDAAACGLSSATVLMGADPKFLLANAPGVASPGCGMFYDSLEPIPDGGIVDGGTKGNGRVETTVVIAALPQPLVLSYPGCCTVAGFCSGDTSKGESMFGPSNGGYGCMESTIFFRTAPEVGPAGTPIAGLPLRKLPCDPVTGALKLPAPGDAGAGGDGGATDAGATDAGATDAGATDAGPRDASTDAGNG